MSSLQYSSKHDRILCSSFFRLSIAPAFDKYMEWGFVDCSVRFYMAESKKVFSLNFIAGFSLLIHGSSSDYSSMSIKGKLPALPLPIQGPS